MDNRFANALNWTKYVFYKLLKGCRLKRTLSRKMCQVLEESSWTSSPIHAAINKITLLCDDPSPSIFSPRFVIFSFQRCFYLKSHFPGNYIAMLVWTLRACACCTKASFYIKAYYFLHWTPWAMSVLARWRLWKVNSFERAQHAPSINLYFITSQARIKVASNPLFTVNLFSSFFPQDTPSWTRNLKFELHRKAGQRMGQQTRPRAR